jgi:hypothetical protein
LADDITFANTGTGAVPNATVVRTRQNPAGDHIQWADVTPAVPAAVSGGQYALSVGSSSPTSLTVPSGATHAVVSIDVAANTVRWTRDGTSPTSTVGHALIAGDYLEIDNLSNFRVISITGTSTIQVSYHRYI